MKGGLAAPAFRFLLQLLFGRAGAMREPRTARTTHLPLYLRLYLPRVAFHGVSPDGLFAVPSIVSPLTLPAYCTFPAVNAI